MKVRLTSSRVGQGFSQKAGEIIDLPADEAARLIAARGAEPIEHPKPETTMRRSGTGRTGNSRAQERTDNARTTE